MKTSIRYLRKMRGMTLEEVSEKTGITAAHLSLIERNKRDPSIQTLIKIAQALQVDVETFWWNTVESSPKDDAEYELVRKDERKVYKGVYNDKLIYEYVTGEVKFGPQTNGEMEGYIAKLAPGGNTNPFAPTIHKTDEFMYVLRGKMICEIENEHIIMSQGDSVTIKKNMAHRFINEFDEEVEVLMIRCPYLCP